MLRTLFCFTFVALLSLPLTARAQTNEARLLLKLGVEHDSNSRREVGEELAPDQALRLFSKLGSLFSLGALGDFDARLLFGAKAHLQSNDQDAFVTSAQLAWRRKLIQSRDFVFGALANLELGDRSERSSERDYSRASASLGLSARYDALSLSVAGGGHAFLYKPELTGNHDGWLMQSHAAIALLDELHLSLSYALIDRAFDTSRFVEVELLIVPDDLLERRDTLHALRAALAYHADFLLSLAYTMQLNRSNSVGPGLLRHGAELAWTHELWWQIVLSLNLRLLRTQYDDPVRIDQTLSIDDADRNEWMLSLSFPLMDAFELELRYAGFTEALGSNADFSRHLIYLGINVELDGS